MKIGRKRHRVQIQEATETTAATGEVTSVWRTIARAWASIEPFAGKEYLQSQQAQASASVRIGIAVIPGLALSVKHRILFGVRVFEINDIANVQERGIEWEIRCTEAAA